MIAAGADAALLDHARRELKAREGGATDPVAAAVWRRIVALLEGALVLGPGECAADAFSAMLTAVQAALDLRIEQCAALARAVGGDGAPTKNCEAHERRIGALKELRDRLLRSAIRAGAALPREQPPRQPREPVHTLRTGRG